MTRKTKLSSSLFSNASQEFANFEFLQLKYLREAVELVHALAKSAVFPCLLMAADLAWPQILQLPPPKCYSRSLLSHLIFHKSSCTFQACHNSPSSISWSQLDTTDFLFLLETCICHRDCSSPPIHFKHSWAHPRGMALLQTGQHSCFLFFTLFFFSPSKVKSWLKKVSLKLNS